MGATASQLPRSTYTTTMSTTRLFTVRNYYAKLAEMPVGGGNLTLETSHFRGHDWRVEVNKVGLNLEGSVGVHVCPVWKHNETLVCCMDEEKYYDETMENVKISIEILNKSGEHADFNNHYRFYPILVVTRRELEERSCVRKGSLTIRVTLSQDVAPPSSYTMLKMTRLFTVTGYSKSITRMPPGSELILETFQLRGQGWCVKLITPPLMDPRIDWRVENYFVVAVTCVFDHGCNPWELKKTRLSIQILDKSGKYAVFRNHTAGERMGSSTTNKIIVVYRRELEASSCIHNDSFTIRYTLFTEPEPHAVLPAGSHIPGTGSRNVIKSKMLPAAMVPPTAGVGSASRLPPPPCSLPKKSPSPPICTPQCLRRGRPFGTYRRVEDEEVPLSAAGDTIESDQTPLLSAMYC